MTNNLTPELQTQIIEEAKNFAFYNYVSAAQNGSAVFDDIESWPDNAQVAYYALVNYTSGRNVCWPYTEPTLPIKWQAAEQRATELRIISTKQRNLLEKFISRHEAGLLPDRFIYDEIKSYLIPKQTTDERRL